jgi:16S rRNA (cytosine967-C5)-methyltransferase
MKPTVLEIAAAIIHASSRQRPADAVLRSELKSQSGLSRADSTEVTRLVFGFYRWFGWLDKQPSLAQQLERAFELAQQFAKQPESFSDAELVSRAVPDWTREHVEVTPEWARALQSEPALWLRARPGEGKLVSTKLGNCRAFGEGALGDILKYNGREDLFRHPAFQEGAFELQDISSQAVGLICAPQSNQTWWDACAGEGGKLLHLSALMGNKGLVWATDRAAWRLDKLKRRAARARVFNCRTRVWNGGENLPTKTRFDGVLVDAPCSGIGTWQRNPHARWTTTPQDVSELAEVQKRLVRHVAPAVKPGGKLIYAVCSLARSETTEVAQSFLAEHPFFETIPTTNPLAPDLPSSAQLWLWPQQFGGNGMFISAWSRQT